MAERTGSAQVEEAGSSPGSAAAELVRAIGAGAADLTEDIGRAGVAALAGTVRGVSRVWGEVLGRTIDVVVAATTPRRRRRPGADAPGGRGAGPRRCVDLIDLRTGEQIDAALSEGLAAAGSSRRTRTME